jgi:hypothetical protein
MLFRSGTGPPENLAVPSHLQAVGQFMGRPLYRYGAQGAADAGLLDN